MKSILFFCMLFFVITSPAYSSDLSDTDLNRIRLIVKEEIAESEKRLKDEIAKSERQMKLYVDPKFESIDKRMTLIVGFVSALVVLIVVTVGIPQILIALRSKGEEEQNKRIDQLTQELEALKQQRIINP